MDMPDPIDGEAWWAALKPFLQGFALFGGVGIFKCLQIVWEIYRGWREDNRRAGRLRSEQSTSQERDYFRAQLKFERRSHEETERERDDGLDAIHRLHALAHRLRHAAIVNQANLLAILPPSATLLVTLEPIEEVPELSQLIPISKK